MYNLLWLFSLDILWLKCILIKIDFWAKVLCARYFSYNLLMCAHCTYAHMNMFFSLFLWVLDFYVGSNVALLLMIIT